MAISLATTARVLFPDDPRIAGLTNFTVACTLVPAASRGGDRMAQQWGSWASRSTTGSWILHGSGVANEIELMTYYNEGWYGFRTNAACIAGTALVRIIARAFDLGGAGKGIDIWINGVKQALVETSTTGGYCTRLGDSDQPISIGWEPHENTNCLDGQYSEVAIWGVKVPDWFAQAYGLGESPARYPVGGILYAPLTTPAYPVNVWTGVIGANTGGKLAPHPAMSGYGIGRHGLTTKHLLNEALKGGQRAGSAQL